MRPKYGPMIGCGPCLVSAGTPGGLPFARIFFRVSQWMPSSAITWRLLTPSTHTVRRISIQRSISVNTPFPPGTKSSTLRKIPIVLAGLGGVTLFDRLFEPLRPSHYSTGVYTIGFSNV